MILSVPFVDSCFNFNIISPQILFKNIAKTIKSNQDVIGGNGSLGYVDIDGGIGRHIFDGPDENLKARDGQLGGIDCRVSDIGNNGDQ